MANQPPGIVSLDFNISPFIPVGGQHCLLPRGKGLERCKQKICLHKQGWDSDWLVGWYDAMRCGTNNVGLHKLNEENESFTCFHVFIERSLNQKSAYLRMIQPWEYTRRSALEESRNEDTTAKLIAKVNNFAAFFFPIVTVLFNSVYFSLSKYMHD